MRGRTPASHAAGMMLAAQRLFHRCVHGGTHAHDPLGWRSGLFLPGGLWRTIGQGQPGRTGTRIVGPGDHYRKDGGVTGQLQSRVRARCAQHPAATIA